MNRTNAALVINHALCPGPATPWCLLVSDQRCSRVNVVEVSFETRDSLLEARCPAELLLVQQEHRPVQQLAARPLQHEPQPAFLPAVPPPLGLADSASPRQQCLGKTNTMQIVDSAI